MAERRGSDAGPVAEEAINRQHISLRAKVLLVVLLAVVCIQGGVQGTLVAVRYVLIQDERYAALDARILLRSQELSRHLAEPLRTGDRAALRDAIDTRLEADRALRAVTVSDSDGAVVVGRVQVDERIIDTEVVPRRGMYRLDSPLISDQGEILGAAEVAYSDAPLQAEMRRFLLEHLLVLVVGIAVLVAALVFAIQRIVIKRLRTAVAQADAIRSGDLATRIPPTSGDEFDHLAIALNDMRSSLRTQLDDLAAANARLEQAMELRTRFLANMSHEIRTPMNGVIGSAQLIAQTPLDAEQRELVETMERSGEAALAVINDILDLSKIEAGEMQVDPRPCDLRALLDEVVGEVAEDATGKGLSLAAVVDPSIDHRLVVDRLRLRQVLLNLVHNAVKFTPAGSVVVRATVTERTRDHCAVTIAVEDTGIGIPDEIQSALFQPFMQADGSTTRRFGGTGLGLTISKQLIALMDGSISVTSDTERGSVFRIVLRLGVEEGAPIRPRCACSEALLFSDDPVLGEAVTAHLAAAGITVQPCPRDAVGVGSPRSISLIDCVHEACVPRACLARVPGAAILLLTRQQRRALGEELRTVDAAVVTAPPRAAALWEAIADRGARGAGRRRASESSRPRRLVGRVLLVEDHVDNREVIARQLAMVGLETHTAGNGQEALDRLETLTVDVVLMDCHMPVLDGFAATARLRERGFQGPIVALTANVLAEDRERCLAGGMDDHIGKPVTHEALARVLRRFLPAADDDE